MNSKKIQWHPGFVAAMNLEFALSRDGLVFQKEYNLNTRPLAVDLLIIKKEASVQIDNEIGTIFRGHNIMEYKSPEDIEYAGSVLEVSIGANRRLVEEMKGDAGMCQALMEIMEPQLLLRDEEKISEGIQRGIEKGMQEGIYKTIDVLRKFGHKKEEIKAAIMEEYGLSAKEAEGHL